MDMWITEPCRLGPSAGWPGFTARTLVAAFAFPGAAFAAVQTPPQTPPQTVQPVNAPAKGLQFQTGDYAWKFGGYIKVDVIHDFDPIGSTDTFDTRTIPTSGVSADGDSTRIHARQTRFNVDLRGPTSIGPFRAFAEGDFFSDQNGFRMRHAYGVVGEVLGGQTWSTFMDEDGMPETLDFESPTAFPMVRQAQVRWTHEVADGKSVALAIEDPDSDVIPPAGVPGTTKEPLPDLNARLRWDHSRGHVQLGLFSGMARFDPDAGSPDDVWLWGFNFSTKLETTGKDNAIVQVTYGDGVGRYRGGNTAAPDASGDLEAIPIVGVMGSYQHHWSEEYRSTIGYSWGDADVPDGAPPATTNEMVTYGWVNWIWQFCDRAWAGIEWLHGSRETFDDANGYADRLQIALRFDL